MQCRLVQKKSSPENRRRVVLPADVTFAGMALILEEILEFPRSSKYEFEFYKGKMRYVEWDENQRPEMDMQYSVAAAQDRYVSLAIEQEKRFTFRLKEGEWPEYRVEVGKILELSDPDVVDVQCPLVVEESPSYADYEDILADYEKGVGIARCEKPVDRMDRWVPSFQRSMGALGDMLDRKAKPAAAAPGRILPKECTMRDVLEDYSPADLREIAETVRFTFTRKSKEAMAKELSNYLLDPGVMRQLLLRLSPEELEAFGKATQRSQFRPDRAMDELLYGARDLGYVADYSNGRVEIPKEVIFLYEGIRRNDYEVYHREMHWVIACDYVCAICYGSAPERVFLEMVNTGARTAWSVERLKREMNRAWGIEWNCRWLDGRVMHYSLAEAHQYLQYERRCHGDGYYRFSAGEIRSVFEQKYPAEPSYHKFRIFLIRELGAPMEAADRLCRFASEAFSMDGVPSELARAIEEEGLQFRDRGMVERYAKLVMEMNNHTRKACLKGHKPVEMRR